MNANPKITTETARSTIPQPMLERIEKEWQQMRASAATAPKSSQSSDDRN